MGNCFCKHESQDWKKDEKYMWMRDSEYVKPLNRWKKEYGFSGTLNVTECKKLVTDIQKKTQGKSYREKKESLHVARKWLEEAQKRQAGIQRGKEKRKATETLALTDKEDDNAVNPVQQQLHPNPPPYPSDPPQLYPDLTELTEKTQTILPQESQIPQTSSFLSPNIQLEGMKLRSGKVTSGGWALGPSYNKQTNPSRDWGSDLDEQFPLIEVPNPRAGQEDEGGVQPQTMYVYRPWTNEDVNKATDGIPHPREDVRQFAQDIAGLRESYKLNGAEIERACRRVLGPDWCLISGDWNPNNGQGRPLPWNDPELGVRVTGLMDRINGRYRRGPDWIEVNKCVQGEEESVEHYYARLKKIFDTHSGIQIPDNMQNDSPYEQMLKNALMKGLTPQIGGFVTKYMINHRTARLNDVLEHCKHAERHFKDKKKTKGKKATVYVLEAEEGQTVFFQTKNKKGKDRKGRDRERGEDGTHKNSDDICYNCGKKGHWARDCRAKKKKSQGEKGRDHYDSQDQSA